MNFSKLIGTLFLLLFYYSGYAQPVTTARATTASATLTGKVIDKKNGDELIGVRVVIKETKAGTATDIDGAFLINDIAPGKYTVVFFMDTYRQKEISVTLKEAETITLNTSLEEFGKDLDELTVKGERDKESVNTLLVKQKTSTSVSDGISADAIKRSPDNNTSDVMKRISGASIQDNKFAIIRGLNDRYNIGYINGAPLPSTESDRKAFSFDIFPSNMLDNMVVLKTATPEMPADFAGGIILINTKDFPDKNYFSLSAGTSVNTITTFKKQLYYQGSRTEWAGIDDGTRLLPKNLPSDPHTYRTSTDEQKVDYSRQFTDIWQVKERNALPSGSFQFSSGHRFKMKSNSLGLTTSLSYSNSNRFTNVTRKQNIVPDNNVPVYEYHDESHRNEILWGAMVNVAYKIGDKHKLTLKNIYTINAEDQTNIRRGYTDLMNTPDMQGQIENTALWYQQNNMLTNQLTGEHYLPASKIKIKWVGGYNNVKRYIPDFRRVSYRKTRDTDEPFAAQIGPQVQLEQGGRFFSTLNENLYSGSFDASMPANLGIKKGFKNEIKVGALWQGRSRQFDARSFGYVVKGSAQTKYPIYGLDSIFNKENFEANRFYIEESTNYTDSYDGGSTLYAGFIQFDSRILTRLRAVYGVRMESYNQRLNSLDVSGQPENAIHIDTTIVRWLPSINLTYELTEKSNIRACYSQTVSRPELREIAPFAFYDFNLDAVVSGNPNLKTTSIKNYDLRWEYFPSGGEVVSASVFYKSFENPVEFINEPNSGAGSRRYGYANAPKADNLGFEFEFRKKLKMLDRWFKTDRIFENLTVNGNFAYIISKVDLSKFGDAASTSTGVRTLQGQSPYIINGGFQYFLPKSETSFSLLVNRVGRRIAFVGNAQTPDIYENPRTVLDFQMAFRMLKKKNMDVKINFSDILAQDLVFYQDIDNNKKYNGTKDNLVFNYTYGRNISLGVTYRF